VRPSLTSSPRRSSIPRLAKLISGDVGLSAESPSGEGASNEEADHRHHRNDAQDVRDGGLDKAHGPSIPPTSSILKGDIKRANVRTRRRTGLARVRIVSMFGDLLRGDRERAGMSVEQAARRFGVSTAEYRSIEAGARYTDFNIYDAICRRFGWRQAFPGDHGTEYVPRRGLASR
jgi:ribosome-binding protein aMBF1 (putative translation factor)